MVNSHITVMDPDDRQCLIARSAVRKKKNSEQSNDPMWVDSFKSFGQISSTPTASFLAEQSSKVLTWGDLSRFSCFALPGPSLSSLESYL